MSRITQDQNDIARAVYRDGKRFGVAGVSTKSPRRVHCGFDATAYFKPLLVVHGSVTDKAAVCALASGWIGDIEFQN